MASIQNNLYTDVVSFIRNHPMLCVLTCGLAAVVYAVGNLAGRVVSWIGECVGVTKTTDEVARQQLSSMGKVESSVLKKNLNAASIPNEIKASFQGFIQELEEEIFPYYVEHENTFDKHAKIHSRMHISRAFLFTEVMLRYWTSTRQGEVKIDFVRRAIALHDAGRKGNGIDRWEKDSAEILRQYLIRKGISEKEANELSKVIIKGEDKRKDSVEGALVQSGDCLDIMRPCCGHNGIDGFKPQYLTFLRQSTDSKDVHFREALIREAWIFIQKTEEIKCTLNESKGFMQELLNIIEKNSAELPILSSLLIDQA